MRIVPHSIAGRLLLIELLAGLPALVLLGYWLIQVRRENREQAHDTARRAVQVVVQEHAEILEDTRRLLGEVAARLESAGSPAACAAVLGQAARPEVEFQELAVVDSAGRVVCRAGGGFAVGLPADPTWWRDAARGAEPIVRYAFLPAADPAAGVVLIARALRTADPSGRVVAATIDLEWMNQQGAIAALPAGSALTMVDESGRVLVREPNPEAFVGGPDQATELSRSMAASTSGTIEAEGLDGVTRVYVFEPLQGGGAIRVGIPSDLVYAQYRRARRPAFFAGLFTVVTAFLLSRVAATQLILRRASSLSGAANALREGRLGVRTGVTGQDELARTAVAFDEMADKLESTMAQLQEIARRSQAALEEERKRISRTIHDEIGQELTALQMELARSLPTAQNPAEIRLLIERVAAALQRVRTAALELRPAMLDDLGLCAAVEWQVREFCRRTGLECSLATDPAADDLHPDVATAAFRILQEALTNVARHAHAASVQVSLASRGGYIELDVVDDGRGLPAERNAESLGVLGMTERARAVGGVVELETVAPRGTRLRARLPHGLA